jgi:hypothetical protein
MSTQIQHTACGEGGEGGSDFSDTLGGGLLEMAAETSGDLGQLNAPVKSSLCDPWTAA